MVTKGIRLLSFSVAVLLLAACGGSTSQYPDLGNASVIDAGSNIVVVGQSWNGSNYDMAIWRYDANGVLDTAFDTDGIVTHDNAAGATTAGHDLARAVVLDGTDIVVVGQSWNGSNYDMAIWRYDANGVLDTAFDTDGIVTHDNATGATTAGNDVARAVVIDGSSNVVVAGNSWNGNDIDMAIWRYTSAGVLDTAFDGDGIVIHDNAAGGNAGQDVGRAIALDGTDIIVVGDSFNGTNPDLAIWRYDSVGVLDGTFGTLGIVTDDNAAGGTAGTDAGRAVVLDGTDIVITGQSHNGSDIDMVVWRYDVNGAPDNSFGTNGIVTDDNAAGGTTGQDIGRAIALDGTDILVAGDSHNGSNLDMVIWRYDNTGALVTTFDTDGIVIHDNAAGGTAGNDFGSAVVIDGSGNVVVAGSSDNSLDSDMVLWRYLSTGVLDTGFNSTGIVVHDGAAR